jgi:hypothetical protein
MNRKTLVLLASTMLLVSTACGGGSSGVAGGAGAGSTNLAASFMPAVTTPGPKTVSLAQANNSGNMVTLQFNITDTDDVHTAAFDVLFDDALVEFVGHSSGTLLEQGGNTPLYQVGLSAGRIVVGVSRGGSGGATATGSQSLMRLTFRVINAGQSQLAVVNATLKDGNLDTIPGVTWHGGSILGN